MSNDSETIYRGLTAAYIDMLIQYAVEGGSEEFNASNKELRDAHIARLAAACQQINLENATDEDYD